MLFVLSVSSCKDEWTAHYSEASGIKSDLNLYDYMKSQKDLSIFTKLVKVAGYDTILSKSQTYTIWAPKDSVLTGITIADTVKFVENHIARFSHPTSDLSAETIFMIDSKLISFARTGASFTFGGMLLDKNKSNIATRNGIIHYINNFVPYLPNIWEFIGSTTGLDSLRKYLYSNNKLTFNLAASGQDIGTNANGQLLYDSVFTLSNKILNNIGQLNIEDSIYTAILPDNNAWNIAYAKIKPYFNTFGVETLKQRNYIQYSLVQDLIFRKPAIDPTSLDSIVSTSNSVFHRPDSLFMGTTKHSVSNGSVYVSSGLNHKSTESWNKEIRIEAETDYFGRFTSNANLYPKSSSGSGLSVSLNKYILVNNLTTNTTSACFVTFPIPNTLSTKYNIYCVFVPTSIVDKKDLRPSRADFYLTSLSVAGKPVTKKITFAPKKNETDPTKITKMFVTQVQFPYCNIVDFTDFKTTSISVSLRIQNTVTMDEANLAKNPYNRDMLIDCIILEPVQ